MKVVLIILILIIAGLGGYYFLMDPKPVDGKLSDWTITEECPECVMDTSQEVYEKSTRTYTEPKHGGKVPEGYATLETTKLCPVIGCNKLKGIASTSFETATFKIYLNSHKDNDPIYETILKKNEKHAFEIDLPEKAEVTSIVFGNGAFRVADLFAYGENLLPLEFGKFGVQTYFFNKTIGPIKSDLTIEDGRVMGITDKTSDADKSRINSVRNGLLAWGARQYYIYL